MLASSENFALAGFPLVEFDRKPIDRELLKGFIIEIGPQLTLIQKFESSTYRLNGYAIFCNSDVRRWRNVRKDEFLARAARQMRLRPSNLSGVSLASLGEALASAGSALPLITIHQERIKRDVCYVGKFISRNQRSMSLHHISPDAEWDEKNKHHLKDITMIEFGGVYETLLAKLAPKLIT